MVFVLSGKNAYIKRKKTIYNCVHVNEILRILFSSVILTDLITKSWVLGQLKIGFSTHKGDLRHLNVSIPELGAMLCFQFQLDGVGS